MSVSGRSPTGEAHHQTGSSGGFTDLRQKIPGLSGKSSGDTPPRARGFGGVASVASSVAPRYVRVLVSWPSRGFDLGSSSSFQRWWPPRALGRGAVAPQAWTLQWYTCPQERPKNTSEIRANRSNWPNPFLGAICPCPNE